MDRMPAVFLGHGSPMNTLEENCFTSTWREIGASVPRPRAILAVSAHWYFGATAVTAMEQPRTIHDFYGFPPELYAFQYPAPGAPDVAAEIAEAVKPMWLGLDHNQWGIDHGTWSVLAHLYPDADVPVVQLSLNAHKPLEYHLELGRRLSPLRERGIMIVGSGNVVHNLSRIDWSAVDRGFDWAQRFDEAVNEQLAKDPANVLAVTSHPDYRAAVPTPDHFLPLLYVAALASAEEPMREVIRGYSLGAISMTCYAVGAELSTQPQCSGSAPLPQGVPPDNTNV